MIIRKPKKEEIKRIKCITKRAYEIPFRIGLLVTKYKEKRGLLDYFIKKQIGILVGIIDEKIVGAIRYKFTEENNLYFFKLAVLKKFRNQGVGSRLVGEVEKIAKKRNCKKILLDCAQEKGLVPFYESLGYKVDKIQKHGDHHDVFMSKKI